jgi:hypothetical protein
MKLIRITLSVVMPSVVMLNVIMPSVVAPKVEGINYIKESL